MCMSIRILRASAICTGAAFSEGTVRTNTCGVAPPAVPMRIIILVGAIQLVDGLGSSHFAQDDRETSFNDMELSLEVAPFAFPILLVSIP